MELFYFSSEVASVIMLLPQWCELADAVTLLWVLILCLRNGSYIFVVYIFYMLFTVSYLVVQTHCHLFVTIFIFDTPGLGAKLLLVIPLNLIAIGAFSARV